VAKSEAKAREKREKMLIETQQVLSLLSRSLALTLGISQKLIAETRGEWARFFDEKMADLLPEQTKKPMERLLWESYLVCLKDVEGKPSRPHYILSSLNQRKADSLIFLDLVELNIATSGTLVDIIGFLHTLKKAKMRRLSLKRPAAISQEQANEGDHEGDDEGDVAAAGEQVNDDAAPPETGAIATSVSATDLKPIVSKRPSLPASLSVSSLPASDASPVLTTPPELGELRGPEVDRVERQQAELEASGGDAAVA
jgi:hypothetical protein